MLESHHAARNASSVRLFVAKKRTWPSCLLVLVLFVLPSKLCCVAIITQFDSFDSMNGNSADLGVK